MNLTEKSSKANGREKERIATLLAIFTQVISEAEKNTAWER